MIFIDILVCIIAIMLIIVVMLQSSKDDIKDAFSGEKTELFKNQKTRGVDKALKTATAILATVFIILVIVSRIVPR